jgi:hypothetical protein
MNAGWPLPFGVGLVSLMVLCLLEVPPSWSDSFFGEPMHTATEGGGQGPLDARSLRFIARMEASLRQDLDLGSTIDRHSDRANKIFVHVGTREGLATLMASSGMLEPRGSGLFHGGVRCVTLDSGSPEQFDHHKSGESVGAGGRAMADYLEAAAALTHDHLQGGSSRSGILLVLGLREAVMRAFGSSGSGREASLRLLDLVYMSSDASTRHRGLVTFMLWEETTPPPRPREDLNGSDEVVEEYDGESGEEDRAWSVLAEALGHLGGPSFNPRSFLGRIDGVSVDPSAPTLGGPPNTATPHSPAIDPGPASLASSVEGGAVTGASSSTPMERICARRAAAQYGSESGVETPSSSSATDAQSSYSFAYLVGRVCIGIGVCIVVAYVSFGVTPIDVSTPPSEPSHDVQAQQRGKAGMSELSPAPSDTGRSGARARGPRTSGTGTPVATVAIALDVSDSNAQQESPPLPRSTRKATAPARVAAAATKASTRRAKKK